MLQNILLLPVVFLLWFFVFRSGEKSKVLFFLLLYSALLTLVISIGGLVTMRTGQEVFANLIFLPITIELIILLIARLKTMKKTRNMSRSF